MPELVQSKLPSLQDDIRKSLQGVIECGATHNSLVFLFGRINQYAWEWLNEKPRKVVSQDMTCLFSASSAVLSQKLHAEKDAMLLSKLVEVLESAQRDNGNYEMTGLEELPADRLQITATGGERGCRTLYVTIATGLICSNYLPTVVQGNYSVTGCNCGLFAESDMMEHFQYRLGSSAHDIGRLKRDNFAYLHVQRYQPILKVFCSERGALGFRDMMKLATALADPFRCQHQYIGVWDKEFITPMARALVSRNCVKNGAVVASDHIDEFTDCAAVAIKDSVTEVQKMNEVSVTSNINLQSEDSVEKECGLLKSFFREDWSNPSVKLELVLQNAALALAVAQDPKFLDDPILSIKSWRKQLLRDQESSKKKCLNIIESWKAHYVSV